MSRTFKDGNGAGQPMLMPAGPREWLPAGHLAWRVLELAGEMDPAGPVAGRPGRAGRPHHPASPAMMATPVLYGSCRGRRSCREIQMATRDDAGARIISRGPAPRSLRHRRVIAEPLVPERPPPAEPAGTGSSDVVPELS